MEKGSERESKEREDTQGERTVFTALRPEVVTEVSGSFGLGMGRVPKAIPTMAIM